MKTSELMSQIESRIKELATRTEEAKASEEVTQYLRFLSRFHRYSLHNTMAIWIHCPNATHVAGYNAWMKLGRYVRKGERGIPIFAPCTQAVPKGEEEDDEKKTRKVIGYKVVYVFDASQTEGKPLPEAPIVARGMAVRSCA
jgi:antirestriction protein ArdC